MRLTPRGDFRSIRRKRERKCAHERHDHHSRPHHHAARAVAADAVAQGPRLRRRPQLSGGRCRDQRRHHRHGLSVPVPAGHPIHHRLPRRSDHPARHRQGRQRRRGDLAGFVEDHHHVRPRRHRHHGDVGARHRAVGRARQSAPSCRCTGCGDIIARKLPAYGSGCFRGSRRRRHDREGAALQGARLQGDQDAGRPRRTTCAPISTTSNACAKRSGPTSTS